MSTQEAVSSVLISGMAFATLIVLIVNVRGCNETTTESMLKSGHVMDGHGAWIKPKAGVEP